MEINLDLEADALYIKFQEGKFSENRKIDEEIIVDLDKEGNLLGIEILNISKRVAPENLEDVNVKLPLKKSSKSH